MSASLSYAGPSLELLADLSDVRSVPQRERLWQSPHVSNLINSVSRNRGRGLIADSLSLLDYLCSPKLVYMLDRGRSSSRTAELRGGKGAGLAKLSRLGMPVPAGATIVTSVARALRRDGELPVKLGPQLSQHLQRLERQTGLRFGSRDRPLLVSVRSGAKISMPGMMDTVLNVGLNEDTLSALRERFGARFAWDTYRRFLSMFGATVMGVGKELFEERLTYTKKQCQVSLDSELPVEALRALCHSFKRVIAKACDRAIPDDPIEQLNMAIFAVIASWNSERAIAYRRSEEINDDAGTAVNIQAMVFGNADDRSGTGVVFSRDPSSGVRGLYGEYLVNAQGEDVVAGVRTPQPVSVLRERLPVVYAQLEAMVRKLEEQYEAIVDVEFTVEQGRLYILQCRPAKRTAVAAVTFAVDQINEKKWTKARGFDSIDDADFDQLGRPVLSASTIEEALRVKRLLLSGQAASPGAAVGRLAFSCERAIAMAGRGESVILVRPDTSPDDLPAMLVSAGIITAAGGTTSHAAVVARGKGIPAVVGCQILFGTAPDGIQCLGSADSFAYEGDLVSLDGALGLVLQGALSMDDGHYTAAVKTFLDWVNEVRALAQAEPINMQLLNTEHNINVWLNDFYLSNLMAVLATDTPLHAEARQLQDQIEKGLADILLTYLALACISEIRYFSSSRSRSRTISRLQSKFGVALLSSHTPLSNKDILANVARSSLIDQTLFFSLCADNFNKEHWMSCFGGRPWGRIAEAGRNYLNGRLPRAVFIDHVFDLRHNGGRLFDKHAMVENLTRENMIVLQLDAKKTARDISDLYWRLNTLRSFTAPVSKLYEDGAAQCLWLAPPNVVAAA